MASFIDFAELKEKLSMGAVVELLDLKIKQNGNQWRGPCPACNSGGDRALVVTEGRGYYCFAQKRGGDQIALAAHILDIPAKDAAQHLAERAGIVPGKGTVPSTGTVSRNSPRERGGSGSKLEPLSYLEPDHDAVVALGLDPKACATHGLGYAPRGVCRGSVAIPFRDENGELLGYFAVQELFYIPPLFQPPTNVVPLKRPA